METYIKIKAWRDCYDIRDINTMTIGELIEDLRLFPADAKIAISFDQGYIYGGITYDQMEYCRVETKAEQEYRERMEAEEEENEICVCPYCGSENICVGINGGWSCLEEDCGKRFKKANIVNLK